MQHLGNSSLALQMSRSSLRSSTATDSSATQMVNSELFTLTYGALVADMVADLESDDLVNAQLDKIGFNIGTRIADDLLAKNHEIHRRCTSTQEIADVLSRVALKNYLGITSHIQQSNLATANEFSLVLDSNPLTEFVELPVDTHKDLRYSQIICGAIRGALDAFHLKTAVFIVSDVPDQTEIRVQFERVIREHVATGDED